ncbi:MAG: nucleotidyltransferase domain-containing protein [bacterium]|nr:nucleotidyltransferase domain-containing protein [bacterium]
MGHKQIIIDTILGHLPGVQAIYLFGTWDTADEWLASDVDMAVLLTPQTAKTVGSLLMAELHGALESALHKMVDLVNLRRVSTVFQKEIITTGRRIYCDDDQPADEFEMVTLSLYQKLNAERAGILEEARKSGRLYNV